MVKAAAPLELMPMVARPSAAMPMAIIGGRRCCVVCFVGQTMAVIAEQVFNTEFAENPQRSQR